MNVTKWGRPKEPASLVGLQWAQESSYNAFGSIRTISFVQIAVRWKTHVFFLLSLVCSTEGISAYLPCRETTIQTTLLREFKHCNLGFENGHLHARCHFVVKLPPPDGSFSSKPEVLTMEQLLVSEDIVSNVSERCAPACLFLRRVGVRKWNDFPDNLNSRYDHIEMPEKSNPIPRDDFSMRMHIIRPIPYDITFYLPELGAVAMCESKLLNRSGNFSVYGFAGRYHLVFEALLGVIIFLDNLMTYWLDLVSTDAATTVTAVLGSRWSWERWNILQRESIEHLVFYRFNIRKISSRYILHAGKIQHLAFLQCPIEIIERKAFYSLKNLKNISLTSTKLPGIPQDIFYLRELMCLNMSDTNVPPGVVFDFRPVSRNIKSSAVQLITSGSNVTLLHDEALCGFPNLIELHMDGCHLKILDGSPFICLEKLQVLSLQENKITELNRATLEGLTGLSLLNLNRNRLTIFDGTNILIPLTSLRVLHISFNSIQEFRVDKPLNTSPEVIFAQHNTIAKWKPPAFSRMTDIKMLDLSHNEIAVLDNEMLRDLNDIQNVSLSFNPWDCNSCYLNNLHNFLDNHPVQCARCLACSVPEEQHGYPVRSVAWREEECEPLDYSRVYAAVGIFCIMLAAMLVYGVYKSRWNFMCVYSYFKSGIKRRRTPLNVGDYAWDAFVSYHASDSDWVHNVLLQKLESPPLKFRLCVAARDFIPGMLITDNIFRAITQSRVCLFVLSPAFCHSRWCMLELSLAHHHLSDSERSDGLVFVKKEQVREYEMSNLLRLLTRSRTHLEVPPSNATAMRKNVFWLKLAAALE